MLEFGIATLILIVTILVGFPIAYSIGLTTIFYIFITNPANLLVIPIRMFSGINSFTLMALPLFMLAAEIMVRTGISSKLFDFVRITRVGKWRGGLAYVNVLASTIFGSISGAALSDIAGLGKVEIDAMEEDGYEKGFACAITAASSIESPLIPPSNVAILYAGTMALSVGAVLYAGFLPGLLLAGSQMLYIKLNAKRLNLPKHEKQYTAAEKKDIRIRGWIAMGMPLIILIGITAGLFTPTEAAAVAVLYALIVGAFVFKNITVKMILDSLWSAGKTTANLFVITSISAVFAWAIGRGADPPAALRLHAGYYRQPLRYAPDHQRDPHHRGHVDGDLRRRAAVRPHPGPHRRGHGRPPRPLCRGHDRQPDHRPHHAACGRGALRHLQRGKTEV